MIKYKLDDFIINISLLLISSIILIRTYLIGFTNNSSSPLFIFLMAIILILMVVIKRKKVKKNVLLFSLLCILLLLPFFYNNAYLQDGKYNRFFYYIFSILYSILFSISGANKNNFKFFIKILILFSFITSLITWISFFNRSFYINNIVTLLPYEYRGSVIKMLVNNNAYAGLTDHYSRNAFFVVLGILGEIYYFNKKSKKEIFTIVFFVITLFLIGKRGHLLFLIVSMFLTYFIFNGLKIKSTFKFILLLLISSLALIIAVNVIPGVSNVIDRTENSNGDISTGRFELYDKAFRYYKDNDNIPLGWYQFEKKTGYTFAGVHNDYIQLFVETGLIGFILVVGVNIFILKKAILFVKKTKSNISILILLYNIFFLLYSLTGIPHYGLENYLVYFILNAFLFIFLDEYYDKLRFNHNFIGGMN